VNPYPNPRRGASLPGGYVADGKGGKLTPAQYRQQMLNLDQKLKDYMDSQGVVPKEPRQ
jgi:hypothetical protein